MKKWLIAISMLCTLGLSGMASADDAAAASRGCSGSCRSSRT